MKVRLIGKKEKPVFIQRQYDCVHKTSQRIYRNDLCSWIGRLSIVRMSVLPKLMYRLNATSTKILVGYIYNIYNILVGDIYIYIYNKTYRRKYGRKLFVTLLRDDTQTQSIREKIDKLNFSKIRKFFTMGDTTEIMKTQPETRNKYLQNTYWEKNLYP